MSCTPELLLTVLANPHDSAPRWIFSDWLDEIGQAERAEFIRLELAIANRPPEKEFIQLLQRRLELIRMMDDRVIEWTWRDHGEGEFISTIMRRGFVEEIELTLEQFMRHAKEAFSRFPITKVKLGDREPFPASTRDQTCFWDTWAGASPDFVDEPHLLPVWSKNCAPCQGVHLQRV